MREQFDTPIGRFEGVEEPCPASPAYLPDGPRRGVTAGAGRGEKPRCPAICQGASDRAWRQAINDAMDVHGGRVFPGARAIPRGAVRVFRRHHGRGRQHPDPHMIIFGQGAIRCHPYVLKEIRAANHSNAARALVEFDHALMGHVVFSIGNGVRSLLHGLTGGYLASAPGSVGPEVQGYYSQLTRFSAAFALLADVSLLVLGGSLKRKEKLSARLGDILSMLYLCSATLKRFKDDDRPAADLPLLHWSIQDALYRMQQAFDEPTA